MSDTHNRGPTSCETCRYRYRSSLYKSHFHCLVYNGKAGRLARERVFAHYMSVWKSSGHVPTFDAIEACPEHKEGKPVCVEIGMAKDADHARRMRSMLADFWSNVVRIDDKSIVIDIAGEVVRVEVMPCPPPISSSCSPSTAPAAGLQDSVCRTTHPRAAERVHSHAGRVDDGGGQDV